MTAPESKWVAEAMRLAFRWRCGPGWPAANKLELINHLQRQADLMERMGEALRKIVSMCQDSGRSDASVCRLSMHHASAALTAFQESKQ
jgi:hypothetical protein